MKTFRIVVSHKLRGEYVRSTWRAVTAPTSGHAISNIFRYNHGKAWFKTITSIEVQEVK